MQHPYLGPKKALRWMAKTHPEAFDRYEKALQNFRLDDLDEWIGYIKNAGKPDRQVPVSRTGLDEEGDPYPLLYMKRVREIGVYGDMRCVAANGVRIKKTSGYCISHLIGLSIWRIDRIMSADVFWY